THPTHPDFGFKGGMTYSYVDTGGVDGIIAFFCGGDGDSALLSLRSVRNASEASFEYVRSILRA
ncbi:MAG: hypothetical protein K9M55_11825, partial [Candidatus Marinimicrobia bacterium]|nr:hypothetical protein [Candidatus Neomarinimicrobiota bacterium]